MNKTKYLKTGIVIFVSIISVLMSYTNIYSQWTPTEGPAGGMVNTIVSNGNYSYAGGYGGIFISSSGGASWASLYTNLPSNVTVYSVAITGNVLLIGTYEHGIFRSTNNGITWQASNNGLPQDAWVYTIYTASNSIYAGIFNSTNPAGIYVSTDNGITWNLKNAGLPQPPLLVTSFAEIGTNIFASTTNFSLQPGNGIYMSSDNGGNWVEINSGLTNLYVRSLLAYQGTLYAGTAGGVFKSTNLGSSWQAVNWGLPVDVSVKALTAFENVLYAGSNRGVYKSTNYGSAWFPVNAGLLNINVYDLEIINASISAGTTDGAFLSSNGGTSWQSSSYGLINTFPIAVVVSGSNILAGLHSSGGLGLSTDWGMSWVRSNSGLTDDSIRAAMVKGSNVFIGTSYEGAFRSTNNGLSWFPINTGLPQNNGINALAGSDENIYASSQTSVYLTTNYGGSWVSRSNGIVNAEILCLAARQNYVYAGTYQSGIFRSTDYGMNWSQASGFNSNFVVSLLTKDDFVFAGFISGGIYVSSNNGLSWISRNTGLPTVIENVRSFLRYGNYVLAGTDNGIFITSNNGDSWENIGSGLKHTGINSLTTNGASIFAAVYSQGVWKRPAWEFLPTHTVSGQIKYNDNNQPANYGKVKALKYDKITENIFVVDSAQIQSGGFYMLQHVPMDSLFIMAYPDDEYDFVPTYYPSTINWQQADLIYPEGNLYNIDISVYRINNQSNQYHIAGTVYKSESNSFTVANSIIYAKSGNDYKSFGISGNNGLYSVNNLSAGTYNIFCSRIGFNSISSTVSITTSSLESINFHLSNNLIIIDPPGPKIPDKFSLYQNYPNPFNPVTRINYDLPHSSIVELTVYDIQGRELIKLVNNEFKKAGRYSVEFNGTNFASGVYFYRIEAGDYVNSKKMVLVK